MILKISELMIDHYLGDVTVSWFNHHDLPPDQVGDYYPLVVWMKKNANNHDDLPYFKVGLQYLLLHDDFNYEIFSGDRYPYDADEIREIIEFVYNTLWPNSKLPERLPNIELVKIPLEKWWENRPHLPE